MHLKRELEALPWFKIKAVNLLNIRPLVVRLFFSRESLMKGVEPRVWKIERDRNEKVKVDPTPSCV